MISLSHWGMFELRCRIFVIPEGFKLASDDHAKFIAEFLKPDGLIEIVRVA